YVLLCLRLPTLLCGGQCLPVCVISGAVGRAMWRHSLSSAVTQLQPVYYGIAVFQYAFRNFTTTPTGPEFDGFILVAFTAVMVAVSAIALGASKRRGVVH